MNENSSPKADCIYFKGDKPCKFKIVCDGCPHYEPFKTSVLVVKCRAQGDVMRTTAILPGLKKKFPGSFVSWLADPETTGMLAHNPYIDRIHPFDLENALWLESQKFDAVISLDKEPGPAALASRVSADRKFGFGLDDHGNLMIFNPAAEYSFRLGVDDGLKFRRNQKTYQEIVHEAAEIPYLRDEYVFVLADGDVKKAESFFKRHRLSGKKLRVGLNTGAGSKFETKQWPKEYFLKLIRLLRDKMKADVFLLGGKRERELNRELERKAQGRAFNTGHDNTLREFAGFLSLMDVVVCSDTLALHLAVALKKNVVALFGPTCPQEIDLYDRGVKLFAGSPCAPCYRQTCPDMTCMKDIPVERVFEEIKKLV